MIALDKPTAETSVEELTEIVVEEYRRARLAAQAGNGASAAAPASAAGRPDARTQLRSGRVTVAADSQ